MTTEGEDLPKEQPDNKMTTKKEKNYFEKLINIDVSKEIEQKGKLNYLSWAWAWTKIKTLYPNTEYKVYEKEDGINYWTDGKTAWVKTSVTVNEIEHIDYLPIMDYRNQSIMIDIIKSTDVNKAIQRSITKGIARHGLGLGLYIGEDLPKELTKNEEFLEGLDKAMGEEMKAVFKEQNKKQFNDLKDKLQSAESLEEIELIKLNNKKDFNRLKKYATDYFEDLIDVGIKCKKDWKNLHSL